MQRGTYFSWYLGTGADNQLFDKLTALCTNVTPMLHAPMLPRTSHMLPNSFAKNLLNTITMKPGHMLLKYIAAVLKDVHT